MFKEQTGCHIGYEPFRKYLRSKKIKVGKTNFICDICSELNCKLQQDPENEETKETLKIHLDRARKAYAGYKEDIAELVSDQILITLDFRTPITLPVCKKKNRSYYYLSKRVVRYMGITVNIKDHDEMGYVYLFENFKGNWEASVSALDIFFKDFEGFEKYSTVLVYSDNCTSEFKNKFVLGYFADIMYRYSIIFTLIV